MQKRNAQLAKIHIAKKDLGLSDDIYREILSGRFNVASARDLTDRQANELLSYFRSLGWRAKPPKTGGRKTEDGRRKADDRGRRAEGGGRPKNMGSAGRGPLLEKIEAQLSAARRPWAYADGIARRVCKVDRVAWCTPQQLRKIVAALNYDAKRNQRRV